MKLLLAGIVLISIIGTEKCCSFYASNTSKANCINSNKYYHARGNSDAAKRGNGEAHSNTDEILEIYKECSTNRELETFRKDKHNHWNATKLSAVQRAEGKRC
uniref:Uncharacterized protein n=1 Tax=Poecilia reticulata TaxID=8081 RepID=A0A3P9QI35_POERE